MPQRDLSAHWKRLGLLDGAPEPAIEAAWLWQIARHHPDRGGDPETARAINVARDELKGQGAKPNEYVA
ncbi:MAG TPA: molecular chaperone DnaJ, partial [Dehalococcoidia bacterium]|nr:molecular chaperone DnaJ [Dehalococcoidia bacterium]